MPKPKKRVYSKMRLRELSFVDRPAQAPATVTIIKRADVDYVDLAKQVAAVPTNLRDVMVRNERNDAIYDAVNEMWKPFQALQDTVRNILKEGPDDTVELLEAAFKDFADISTASVSDIIEAANEVEAEVEKNNPDNREDTKEKSMPLFDKKALNKGVIDAVAKAMKDGEADVDAIAKSVSGSLELVLGKAEEMYKSLEDTVAKNGEEMADLKKSVTVKTEDADEVHKCMDGTVIRKSEAGGMFAVLKNMDAEIRKSREMAEIEKCIARAKTELCNLPGEELVKGLALHYVNQIDNKDAREGLLSMLKAGNESASNVFKARGTSSGTDAKEETETMKALRKKYPSKQ